MKNVVVVGGSLAGVNAAESLRERGYDGDIAILSAEQDLPYDRPPLSKELLSGESTEDQLLLHPEQWYRDMDIDLRLGARAIGLDAGARIVRSDDGSEIRYDGLVIATGSRVKSLPSAIKAPRLHSIRTLADVRALQPKLTAGRHMIVLGAGFIGLEAASVARRFDMEVTVVQSSSLPLARTFGGEVSRWYRNLHERNGVRFATDSAAASLSGDGPGTDTGTIAQLTNGASVTGDIAVAGIGAKPAVDWLAGSGIELDDGVRCRPDLSTSLPDVVAAGDVARWRNPAFDIEMRVEHWTNAVEQGRHAAGTLLGETAAFRSIPYLWSDQHGTKMRAIGHFSAGMEQRTVLKTDDKLVAVFGDGDVITGAVCVGSPRHLAQYKQAIANRMPWREFHDELATVSM
ncbi:MAG: FAD-dependent oxidoreductase [Microbacterium sp.]|uniref:NAD(P)/FAD-dependent oxidoreductase n=1 Tax=Microbacterium sp. TaxID=51671 RepID=UPI001D48B2E3|nr:FAD-dependent oxidoreductase [Microbacterium sp.]MBW8763283.1 FAD-dependent oxidoreductase [Microbacterium sp.]